MMSKVFAYLDHIFRMVRPRRLLYMAIDGVAPRAKMNQQRSRRFRSALEAEKLRAEAAAKGEPEAAGDPFDSNCITPGTPFMARLSEHLKFYVLKKQTEDPLWQKATVILSGHEVRGEGEHKIMEHIRWARGEPGWDPNQTHCLYGLDADLIMLALVTHEPHFCLLREVVKFGAGANSGQPSRETLQNPTDDGFLLLHVGLLREYLDAEFRGIADALPFPYDCERVVDDFVLLCMLVGNDFLPPLPTLDIAEGALNTLFSTYRELLPTLGGYVSGDDGGGTFDAKRLEVILERMGEMEAKVLADRSRDAAANEERQARRASGGRGFGGRGAKNGEKGAAGSGAGSRVSEADARFKKAMAALANGAGADDAVAAAAAPDAPLEPEKETSSGISADPTMMSAAKREMFEEGGGGIEGWKEMYYREKLGLKIGEAPPLRELRQAYFEGLSWVLQYYYRGVASWTWYYPFHYAPMASDLADGLGSLTAEFDYGVPFRPFEQLLAVQPPQSSALLPEPFRWLMTAPHSPLAAFFPDELKVDFEGKRNDWEGVVLLPFLDEHLLKQCIASVPASKLTDAQIARNKPGPLVVFRHAPEGTGDVASTLPRAFPGLHPCRSQALESMPPGEFPKDRKCFGGLDCLLPNVQLGVKRPPGFPTMHTLKSRGELKNAGVNVFGAASKKESLVVRVDKRGDSGLLSLLREEEDGGDPNDTTSASSFAHLVGRRVHVGWPYLREASVTAVSDRREKIVTSGRRVAHGASEWGASAQKTSQTLLVTKGVDCGAVAVTIHVRTCEGLVRHPDGSLQKRFGKTEDAVPAQLVLAADPNPSPRLAERPALAAASDESSAAGGFRAGDAALFLGRSHFGAAATVVGSDARGLEVSVEPAAPCTGVGRRILQGVQGGRYEHLGAVARKVGLSPRALSQLTGPLWISPTKNAGRHDRVDLGLNLKSVAKGLCVADYSRPGKDGAGWEFSQLTIKLLQDYKKHHGWVFHALMADPENGFEGLELDVALKHVPESERLPALKACKAWIKATPAARRPLVSKFSKVASEAAIKALHATLGGSLGADSKASLSTTLEAVSPLLLMRPVSRGETLDLYAGGDFDLGDRVAAVGDGGSPPFGTRGYVVATHGEACEVLFDHEFVGGTDLHGVLPDKRGALVPGAELVNLSHPPAMPLLGDAAPDRVVADKKGKGHQGRLGREERAEEGKRGRQSRRPEGHPGDGRGAAPGKSGPACWAGGNAEHARARLARLRRRRRPRPRERRRGGPPLARAWKTHARRDRRVPPDGARRPARAGHRRHARGSQPQEHADGRRRRRRRRRRARRARREGRRVARRPRAEDVRRGCLGARRARSGRPRGVLDDARRGGARGGETSSAAGHSEGSEGSESRGGREARSPTQGRRAGGGARVPRAARGGRRRDAYRRPDAGHERKAARSAGPRAHQPGGARVFDGVVGALRVERGPARVLGGAAETAPRRGGPNHRDRRGGEEEPTRAREEGVVGTVTRGTNDGRHDRSRNHHIRTSVFFDSQHAYNNITASTRAPRCF
jgi:5'-3' exoribonuclease 1